MCGQPPQQGKGAPCFMVQHASSAKQDASQQQHQLTVLRVRPVPFWHPMTLLVLMWCLLGVLHPFPPPLPVQPFHGEKELIESDAALCLPLSAVQAKARVFSLEKYQALNRVGTLDFFARLAYRVSSRRLCSCGCSCSVCILRLLVYH